MSNLTDAITTLQYVKGRMPLDHSDNKAIRQDKSTLPTLERLEKRAFLKDTLNNMRSHHRFPGPGKATPVNVNNYGAFAIAAGYGNCLEMACAAAWYINQQGRFNYDLVYYSFGGDHIFVAIGQTADSNGKHPTNFSAWDEDAAICDVWADIACPARDYPERWRARMSNWKIMGLTIANLLPTDGIWSDVVDNPKSSYLTPV